jgi:hypothetical protein
LTQRVEEVPPEFEKLVEEENPSLASDTSPDARSRRPRPRARPRRRMVRRAEEARADEPARREAAALAMRVTSIASSTVRGGSTLRTARHRLPRPRRD